MRRLLIVLTIFAFGSCHEYENSVEQQRLFEKRKDQKLDTLVAIFVSNTGSLDLYYLQGPLTLPKDVKMQLSDTLTRDIKVCGNFPKDLVDMTSWNYDPDFAYEVIGKTILADTNNAVGKVPLFYVTQWTKFYYNDHLWGERGDLGTFPERSKMVNNVVKYFKLEGEKVNEVEGLLGKADFHEQNEIGYKIDEEYGSDIDPIATTILTFTFDSDSIVREKKIEKWEKNGR